MHPSLSPTTTTTFSWTDVNDTYKNGTLHVTNGNNEYVAQVISFQQHGLTCIVTIGRSAVRTSPASTWDTCEQNEPFIVVGHPQVEDGVVTFIIPNRGKATLHMRGAGGPAVPRRERFTVIANL